jgi:hypothetical protein
MQNIKQASALPNTKKGWWSGSRCRPSVQALVLQKKKKKGKEVFV